MNKLHHRILSVFLAAAIAGSSCYPGVYADAAGSIPPENTGVTVQEDSGSASDSADGSCTHLCGEDCVRTELTCTLEETEEHTHTDSCYTSAADCTHVHDGECGYFAAEEPDEEDPEQGAEGGPEQGEQKADPRQQQGEGGQGQGPAGEVGEDVGLHGHDPVDVDLGVDELEQQAGPEAAVAVVLGELPAPEGLPGQKEHIGRPQDQHGQADAGDQGGQQRAEGGAQQHDGGEARPDAEVEGEGPPEAQAAPIGHGHEIVGAGGGRRNHRVGEEGKPGEHL